MGKFEIGDVVRIKGLYVAGDFARKIGVVKGYSSCDGNYYILTEGALTFACGEYLLELILPAFKSVTERSVTDYEIDRITARVAEILAKKPEPKEPEKPLTKYKVGDEVVIRKDLKVGVEYKMRGRHSGTYIADRMLEFCGKKAKIRLACDDYYILCGEGWHWTDEMFAGLASEMPKMARLDKVFPMPDKCIHCPIDCKSVSLSEHWIKEYGGCICRPDDCPLVEVE